MVLLVLFGLFFALLVASEEYEQSDYPGVEHPVIEQRKREDTGTALMFGGLLLIGIIVCSMLWLGQGG